MSEPLVVDTPQGPGHWLISAAEKPRALLLLGHGAGGGIDGIDLVACAELLPAEGVLVARFDQPWHVAGKKVASRPPALDEAWLAGVRALRGLLPALAEGVPLVLGGHSAGARVACRTATALDADQVLCLSFPLHPPGKPEKTRVDELLEPTVPVHVIQGTRDPFGSPDEVAQATGGRLASITPVEQAAHDLKVAARVRTAPEQRQLLADLVLSALQLPPAGE